MHRFLAKTILAPCALLAGASLAPIAFSQAPTPQAPAPTDGPVASDGKPAAQGRIPDGTSKAAATLWRDMAAAIGAPKRVADAAGKIPPRSFELKFDIRHKRIEKNARGSNDFKARLAYLDSETGFVRGIFLNKADKAKQVLMRGPGVDPKYDDYWYRKYLGKGATDGWQDVSSGNDFETDRDMVNIWAEISFDIARLSDPNSFRIAALETRGVEEGSRASDGLLTLQGDPGIRLPRTDLRGVEGTKKAQLRDLAAGLVWLQLRTPDFRLFAKGLSKKERQIMRQMTKRVVFGIDPKSKLPQILIISPSAEGPLMIENTVLFQCTDWLTVGKEAAQSMLPGQLIAYERAEIDPRAAAPRGLVFSNIPSADLYFLEGNMQAGLTPAAFKPEKK